MMPRHMVAFVALLACAGSASAQALASPPFSRLLTAAALERVDATTPSGDVADEVNRRWDILAARVKPGEKIVVTRKDLTTAEGELTGIDERSIEILVRGTPLVIAADDVLTVRRAGVRRRHVWRGILIGMAGGAIVVAAIDHASDHPEPLDAAIVGAVVVGLPAGAAIGALLPTGPPLYEAADRSR